MATNILTNRFDIQRSGINRSETRLTTQNVNVFQFGKLFARAVDGDIYAQPLYVEGVHIPNRTSRNVIYVATANNSLFAFDADDPAINSPYWHHDKSVFGPPVPAWLFGPNYHDFQKTVGITSTPAVDLNNNTIYVVSKSLRQGAQAHHIHAFDLGTGAVKRAIEISAAVQTPKGQQLSFQPDKHLNRASLLLWRDQLFIAFGSHGDYSPYHGWVLAYDAHTLKLKSVFCATPSVPVGNELTDPGLPGGGIWQSGTGIAADSEFIYVASGNGKFGESSYGNCVLKLDPANNLNVVSWYHVPDSVNGLADLDLTAGPVIVEGDPASIVVVGNKLGNCYFVNPSQVGENGEASVLQILNASVSFDPNRESNIHGAPIGWSDRLYLWGEYDYLRCYQKQADQQYRFLATSSMHAPPGMPGAILTLSCNNDAAESAIIWASMPYRQNANLATVDGVLRAFSAIDPTRELWNNLRNPSRDAAGKFAKFCPPTVANGKVYLATFADPNSNAPNELVVYGQLPGSQAPPANRWLQADIGTPIVGSLSDSHNRLIISAAGSDIEGYADEFHYVYRPVKGDCSVVARLRTLSGQNLNGWAKAGVMIRESLEPWSTHAMMVITPQNGSAFQRRLQVSTTLVTTLGPAVSAPYWMRIRRSGNSFEGSVSQDGLAWQVVGNVVIPMSAQAFIGFAVTSHNGSVDDPIPYVVATFDGVQI